MMIIVVYLVGQWETFHRRPMLEALARQALGRAVILCVNPAISLGQAIARFAKRSIQELLFFGRVKQLSPNLYIGTPTAWLTRRRESCPIKDSNRWRMLSQQIRNTVNKINPSSGNIISWIYRPEQASYLGLAKEKFAVYECYDEYSLSHVDGSVIPGAQRRENKLIEKVDLMFTTAHSLFKSRKKKHQNLHYASNGVDFDLFSKNYSIAKDIEKVPSPRIGCIGHFSGKIDFELLEKIAKYNIHWSLVLVGPFAEEVKDSLSALGRKTNVHYLGYKSYRDLPKYVKSFDVCILPFKRNAWNECSNPLRLWQYLAAGKPIVATDLKEIAPLRGISYLADDHEMFISAIDSAMREKDINCIELRVKTAKEHSWDNITRRMFETITENLQ